MKWNEKAQYKARNYLYEREREKGSKQNTEKASGFLGNFLQIIEEMDDYIGEVVDHYLNKKGPQ